MRKVTRAQEIYNNVNLKTAYGGQWGMPWTPEAPRLQHFISETDFGPPVKAMGKHLMTASGVHTASHQVLGDNEKVFDTPGHHATVAQNHYTIAEQHLGHAALAGPGTDEQINHLLAHDAHVAAGDAWTKSHESSNNLPGNDGVTPHTKEAINLSVKAKRATVDAAPLENCTYCKKTQPEITTGSPSGITM